MTLPEYNTDWATHEFQISGEYQMMEKLQGIELPTIFDVGSNIGEWTKMVRRTHPNSNIHMFELIPHTFQKMLRNIQLDDKMFPNNFGISNETKNIPVQYVTDNDRVSTVVMDILHHNSVAKTALVSHPKFYLEQFDISYIDFLKIDTEGHEYYVLSSFMELLQGGNIGVIQFEYGYINVLTKNLLIDFYKVLAPLGYHVGPLKPEGVEFRPFKLFHEDFQGPDYVAVHQSRGNIIELLGVQDYCGKYKSMPPTSVAPLTTVKVSKTVIELGVEMSTLFKIILVPFV